VWGTVNGIPFSGFAPFRILWTDTQFLR
jgi:hypothetical protein